MSDPTTNASPASAGASPAAGESRTIAAQGLANRIVRGMLRTPGLDRVAGRRLVTLYVVGRQSGRRYTVTVAYAAHEGSLLIGTPARWGRNLRTGEPLEVRLRGRRRTVDVEVLTAQADVVAAYAVMCRENRTFASLNDVRRADDGTPVAEDLVAAWARGSRAYRLTPR
jgi:hypothetical protein